MALLLQRDLYTYYRQQLIERLQLDVRLGSQSFPALTKPIYPGHAKTESGRTDGVPSI